MTDVFCIEVPLIHVAQKDSIIIQKRKIPRIFADEKHFRKKITREIMKATYEQSSYNCTVRLMLP